MSQRDPRRNPKVGDVLRLPANRTTVVGTRTFSVERRVIEVTKDSVLAESTDTRGNHHYHSVALAWWRKRAKNAEVIHCADATEQAKS